MNEDKNNLNNSAKTQPETTNDSKASTKRQRSLYLVVASDENAQNVMLENAMILVRQSLQPNQLKWSYGLANKTDQNGQLKLELQRELYYVLINTPTIYLGFLLIYGDNKTLDGKISDKLKHTFYAYYYRDEAEKEAKHLAQLQDQYYDSLLNHHKIYAHKYNILVIDFLELSVEYAYRVALPNIMKDYQKRLKSNNPFDKEFINQIDQDLAKLKDVYHLDLKNQMNKEDNHHA